MTSVFIDANILVSVLNKEYPLFTYTSRILSLADQGNFKLFTSPVCLAIAFYFSEKKYDRKLAMQKICQLINHLHIAEATRFAVAKTVSNSKIKDFEDGLEYYAAIESGCSCIVTENTKDFYFSEIEVINSNDFFLKYMAKR